MSGSIVITQELIDKLNSVIDAGLTSGMGNNVPGEMCVEAAVCYALGLPHGDDPKCVGGAVRAYKIRLNDSGWSSNEARAKGLRRLAIAQLGSDGLDQGEFVKKLAFRTITELLADFLDERGYGKLAEGCRNARDLVEARAAAAAAYAAVAYAADAADAAAAAYAAAVAASADAAAYAAYAAAADAAAADAAAADAAYAAAVAASAKYLTQSANIATEILIEMGSPGAAWL